MNDYLPDVQKTRHPDATRWNERYHLESEGWLSHPTKKLLLEFAHLLPKKGLALDAASGVATNSIFLAEKGLSPIALDISFVASNMAKERSFRKGIRLNAAVCDLKGLWLPSNYFEVIINFCFLERSNFPVFLHSLKPGGLLIFESYLNGSNHVSHPEYYLETGELKEAFSELEIIHSRQVVREIGKHGSGRKLEQLVARKPLLPNPPLG